MLGGRSPWLETLALDAGAKEVTTATVAGVTMPKGFKTGDPRVNCVSMTKYVIWVIYLFLPYPHQFVDLWFHRHISIGGNSYFLSSSGLSGFIKNTWYTLLQKKSPCSCQNYIKKICWTLSRDIFTFIADRHNNVQPVLFLRSWDVATLRRLPHLLSPGAPGTGQVRRRPASMGRPGHDGKNEVRVYKGVREMLLLIKREWRPHRNKM